MASNYQSKYLKSRPGQKLMCIHTAGQTVQSLYPHYEWPETGKEYTIAAAARKNGEPGYLLHGLNNELPLPHEWFKQV